MNEKVNKTELAIATDYAGEKPELETLERTIENIAQAGFTHIHWCHEWDGDYMYSPYEMEQVREWMDSYGLRSKALHASKGSRRNVNFKREHYRRDYTSDWNYNRRAGVELIRNRVELAVCLGASELVLHLYVPHRTIRTCPQVKDEFYSCVCRSFDELIPYCLEKGVKICLENLFDMPEEYMLEAWDTLFMRYPAEFLGICLDTGHANMIWGSRMPELIRRYKDRLFAIHLHDNNGAVDEHMIPGEGCICWKPVMDALAESAYEGPLLLELGCQEPDERVFLRKAWEAGRHLDQLYRSRQLLT